MLSSIRSRGNVKLSERELTAVLSAAGDELFEAIRTYGNPNLGLLAIMAKNEAAIACPSDAGTQAHMHSRATSRAGRQSMAAVVGGLVSAISIAGALCLAHYVIGIHPKPGAGGRTVIAVTITRAASGQSIVEDVAGTVNDTVGNVYFHPKDAVISDTAAAELRRLLPILNMTSGRSLVIDGYAEGLHRAGGDDPSLAEERARVVKDWLVSHGIRAARISTVALVSGDRYPAFSNRVSISISRPSSYPWIFNGDVSNSEIKVNCASRKSCTYFYSIDGTVIGGQQDGHWIVTFASGIPPPPHRCIQIRQRWLFQRWPR